MSEQKQQNVKELQDRVVRYFCVRPANFPAGRPYNCCESVLLAEADGRHLMEVVGKKLRDMMPWLKDGVIS